MNQDSFVFKIGGKAGQGVLSSGEIFQQALFREGFFTFLWNEYPSLIKGGHNSVSVRVSTHSVNAPKTKSYLIIGFDEATVTLHREELVKNGIMLLDTKIAEKFDLSETPTEDQAFYVYTAPLKELSEEIDGSSRYMNTVALGAAFAILGRSLQSLKDELEHKYGSKGEEVVEYNHTAAQTAFDYMHRHYDQRETFVIKEAEEEEHPRGVLMDTNTAIAYGALKAGVKFSAAYPMTPATSIFDLLSKKAPEYNIAVKQAEDEISAMCMTIGAGYAGTRALTMTSGGGFSLMVEGLGLAGMSETPIVAVEAQRGGPSTGLPTKTEQSDLRFLVHAAQGEFPRLIVAPGDPEEGFYEVQHAFNYAEKFQLPAIVLTDKYLATSQLEFRDFDPERIEIERGPMITSADQLGADEYKRYLMTEDGVSPRALPGTKDLIVRAGSDEHDEDGYICEDPHIRTAMMDKRQRKEEKLKRLLPAPKCYGPEEADYTLICWGSNKHICIEAADRLRSEFDYSINVLHFKYLYPLSEETLLPILERLGTAFVVENNQNAQFAGMLTQYIGFLPDDTILKYDGEPFYPEEIAAYVRNYNA